MTETEPEPEQMLTEPVEQAHPETDGTDRYVMEEAAAPHREPDAEDTPKEDDSEAVREKGVVYDFRARSSNGPPSSRQSKGMAKLLNAVAWLILVAGVVGAVLSWTTLKSVEANISPGDPVGLNGLPLGLLLGFAYLATGVLGFAFFWVSSMISRELKDIRRLLLTYPITLMQPPGHRVAGEASDKEDA